MSCLNFTKHCWSKPSFHLSIFCIIYPTQAHYPWETLGGLPTHHKAQLHTTHYVEMPVSYNSCLWISGGNWNNSKSTWSRGRTWNLQRNQTPNPVRAKHTYPLLEQPFYCVVCTHMRRIRTFLPINSGHDVWPSKAYQWSKTDCKVEWVLMMSSIIF